MSVDVDFKKWGDSQHWRFRMERLGTDEHGTWLGGRPPVRYTGPRGVGTFTHGFVVCIPENAWWVASFNDKPRPGMDVECYVDITTVPRWLDDEHVTMIDLDLDVFRLWSGKVHIDDEDEFAEHRVKYGYPNDVIDRAEETTRFLVQALNARLAPFNDVGRAWLEQL